MQDKNTQESATDEFMQCWQAAGRHLQSQVEGGMRTWIRSHLNPPILEHLSFRLGNQLFFVRIEDVDGNLKTPGSEEDLLKIANGCQGYACILPMRNMSGVWVCTESGWGLLSQKDRKPVNPDALVTDKKIEMTDWELHDFAVQMMRQCLSEEKYQILSWNSNPDLQPALWIANESGQEWIIVKAARYPDTTAELPAHIEQIKKNCAPISKTGNFVVVSFANESNSADSTGNENVTPLPLYRGDKVVVRIGGFQTIQ